MGLLSIAYQLISKKNYSKILLIKGWIKKIHKSIDFENLIYYFKGKNVDTEFNDFIATEIHITAASHIQ